MIRLLKILQNFKDIFKKKLFFSKILGGLGPSWLSSGSTTESNTIYHVG